jgi:hypothetical protein
MSRSTLYTSPSLSAHVWNFGQIREVCSILTLAPCFLCRVVTRKICTLRQHLYPGSFRPWLHLGLFLEELISKTETWICYSLWKCLLLTYKS